MLVALLAVVGGESARADTIIFESVAGFGAPVDGPFRTFVPMTILSPEIVL